MNIITIKGAPSSGKTTIAQQIKAFVESLGSRAVIFDDEQPVTGELRGIAKMAALKDAVIIVEQK